MDNSASSPPVHGLLNAVSLQDYESLVSVRQAFVDFLLGDPSAAA
ncbi:MULTISPECIES: hypothetical protein [Arthrobacter]|nr:hypothetical protein [Arthrobacter citreus]